MLKRILKTLALSLLLLGMALPPGRESERNGAGTHHHGILVSSLCQ